MPLSPEQRSSILLQNIDTDDCAVIALQAVTGYARDVAELELSGYYRSRGDGTPRGALENVLQRLGYQPVVEHNPTSPTPAMFALSHEYGTYLLYVKGHVMACVDGNLYNGSPKHWSSPLHQVTQLRPMR